MFFGSYLVRENVLSFNDFVDCVSAQVSSTPSLLTTLAESKALDDGQILKLIDKQVVSKKSLKEVILEEGILNNEELSKVIETAVSKQISFSDVLVKLKKVSRDELEKHLRNFESDKPTQEVVKTSKVEISSVALEALKELGDVDLSDTELFGEPQENEEEDSDGTISQAALDSLRELNPSAADELSTSDVVNESDDVGPDETFIQEFENTYSERMNAKLKKIIEIIFKTADEEGDFSNFFNSLFREFHVIKGAARLASFQQIEDVIEQLENSIDVFFKMEGDSQKKWLEEHGRKLNVVVDEFWIIRNELISNKKDTELSLDNVRESIKNLAL